MKRTFKDVLAKNRKNLEALAKENSHYNEDGDITISPDDPWFQEDEWDEYYKELTKSGKGNNVDAS